MDSPEQAGISVLFTRWNSASAETNDALTTPGPDAADDVIGLIPGDDGFGVLTLIYFLSFRKLHYGLVIKTF